MFKIKTQSRKFNIPLSYFNKLNELTPSQVEYLLNYRDAIKMGGGNPALMERIGIILAKPHIEDPILSKNMGINYNLFENKKLNKKVETKKLKIPERKESWLKNLFKPFDKKTNKLTRQKIF